MLKLIEKFECGGLIVELFKTAHSGPDYHVRYGLQVSGFESLACARERFAGCMRHARACAGYADYEVED